ncbi:MAG: hypothetical protein WA746_16125, partial [Isosphaeraceae bacterium]
TTKIAIASPNSAGILASDTWKEPSNCCWSVRLSGIEVIRKGGQNGVVWVIRRRKWRNFSEHLETEGRILE